MDFYPFKLKFGEIGAAKTARCNKAVNLDFLVRVEWEV